MAKLLIVFPEAEKYKKTSSDSFVMLNYVLHRIFFGIKLKIHNYVKLMQRCVVALPEPNMPA